ncbi:MAG: RimK/LysX family protein [Nanoarchaeota archaeon]
MTSKIDEKNTIGLIEEVILKNKVTNEAVKIKARIDTGAHSNSIDSNLAKELSLGPSIKTTVVKSANGYSLRQVFNVDVIIKDKKIEGKFTIADRSKMKYKILIGRDILSRINLLIDPQKNNI